MPSWGLGAPVATDTLADYSKSVDTVRAAAAEALSGAWLVPGTPVLTLAAADEMSNVALKEARAPASSPGCCPNRSPSPSTPTLTPNPDPSPNQASARGFNPVSVCVLDPSGRVLVSKTMVACCADTTMYSRRLRTSRTGYAYQPPACCTYRRHRAACAGRPLYVRRTRASLRRAVRTAYRVAPQVACPTLAPELSQAKASTGC